MYPRLQHYKLNKIGAFCLVVVCFLPLLTVRNESAYLQNLFSQTNSNDVTLPTENTLTRTETSTSNQAGLLHTSHIKVFYNVYMNPRNLQHSNSIVKEQASYFNKHHDVFIRTIGHGLQDIEGNSTAMIKNIQQDDEGDELGTLTLLWQHCLTTSETDNKVIYIHNKGSLHPNKNNDVFRRFLTRGALSDECANMPETCNVCSSRFTPYPHPHTSGNMWAAKCDYIRKLGNPKEFAGKMAGLETPAVMSYCVGKGRFASEHWVHSHPSVKPCDLSTDEKYLWDYGNIPTGDWEINLQSAPRYSMDTFKFKRGCSDYGTVMKNRLIEYELLYNETVSEDWWGWKVWSRDEK